MLTRIAAALALGASLAFAALAAPGESLGLASLPNLRDAGGYSTADGSRLREGILYRSNQLSGLTEADKERLAALGLRTDFDLRTAPEREAKPDEALEGVAIVVADVLADADPDGLAALSRAFKEPQWANEALGGGKAEALLSGAYREFITLPSARTAYGALFRGLADGAQLPALMHCSSGKDRTGWAAAALLTLLGVPRETVIADYLRSNDTMLPIYADRIDAFVAAGGERAIAEAILGVKREYLEAAFAEVEARYGSIEAYFAEGLGLGPDQQASLRAAFLTR